MNGMPYKLETEAAKSLALWHEMIAERNLERLHLIVQKDAIFRSPMVYAPYASAQAVISVLNTAVQVFEDFTYHRELVSGDGLSVVLEFSARVGDKKLKGIDLIRFDDQGLIVEFEVMVRPFTGLQALGAAMSVKLGDKLSGFKG